MLSLFMRKFLFLLTITFLVGSHANASCLELFTQKGVKRENTYAKKFTVIEWGNRYLLQSGSSFVVTGDNESLPESCLPHYLSMPSILPLSTTTLHFFELLGLQSSVTAFAQKKYISSSSYNKVIDIGPRVDREYLLSLKINLIIGEPHFFDSSAAYFGLSKLGIQSLHLLDYLEEHPLARAEWLIFFSYLIPEPSRLLLAQKKYQQVVLSYLETQKRVQTYDFKKILVGTLLQGQWYAPRETSDYANLLKDARAVNVIETKTGLVNFEHVVLAAQKVDLWLTQSVWDSKIEAMKDDERHALLFSSLSHIYSLKHLTRDAYPFWEEGPARPDLVLKDLVNIVHQEQLPMKYFKTIRESND
jgi:iron complex transport system substrate-binding protein